MEIKLYPELWFIGNEYFEIIDSHPYPWEKITTKNNNIILYDFYFHYLKWYKDRYNMNLVNYIDANYETRELQSFFYSLVNTDMPGNYSFLGYGFDLNLLSYPRFIIRKKQIKNFLKPPALILPDKCVCGSINLSIRNGPYGVYLKCNKCSQNTNIRKFLEWY